MRISDGLEHPLPHYVEAPCAGADAESQCYNRNQRKARRFAQAAQPKTQVLPESFKRHEGSHLPASLLNSRHISKALARGVMCFVCMRAIGAIFFLLHSKMERQLIL